MNKLESILTLVIFALILALIGSSAHIYDLNQQIMEQRVSLFKECVQDFGVRNCTF